MSNDDLIRVIYESPYRCISYKEFTSIGIPQSMVEYRLLNAIVDGVVVGTIDGERELLVVDKLCYVQPTPDNVRDARDGLKRLEQQISNKTGLNVPLKRKFIG